MTDRSFALLNDSSGTLLAASSHAVASLHRPLLAPLNLTYPQYLVLLALDQETPQSSGQLATQLHLSPATMTPLLKRLQELGHIRRDRNTTDERRLAVNLTPAGRDLMPTLCDIGEHVQSLLHDKNPDLHELRDRLETLLSTPPRPDPH